MFVAIRKEVEIFWRSINNDIWATIVPGPLVTIAALYHSELSWDAIIAKIILSTIFFTLYVYSFTLSNQMHSSKEDLLNKAYRPIPSKLMTLEQANKRLWIFTIVFLMLGLVLGVFEWAVLWVVTFLFLNFIGHKHWFTKNMISMTLGIISMIGAGWEIVSPLNQDQMAWAITVSFLFGTMGVIQDFRDVEGDAAIGRKTLSLDISDSSARILSTVFCLVSVGIYFPIFLIDSLYTVPDALFASVILLLYVIIVFRLNRYRDPRSDHVTYMYLLYLFNITLLSAVVVL